MKIAGATRRLTSGFKTVGLMEPAARRAEGGGVGEWGGRMRRGTGGPRLGRKYAGRGSHGFVVAVDGGCWSCEVMCLVLWQVSRRAL